MDQTVKRPGAEEASAIRASLNLDMPGAARQRRRGWLYAVLALLVIAAAFGGWRWYAGTPARIDYTTQPAARADLTVQVSATGTLQPLTQVDISSELSGIVRTVAVEENQQVKKG
ncbi:MAG TPA: biotin/lipoyl-binding protein, partial [Mesorhizobium sp.]|uniref:biotin/lipoyl-binding protein n=1 Tax=Mesorhizobium sp. TaxID=1871066 RepID=UPI002DDD4B7B